MKREYVLMGLGTGATVAAMLLDELSAGSVILSVVYILSLVLIVSLMRRDESHFFDPTMESWDLIWEGMGPLWKLSWFIVGIFSPMILLAYILEVRTKLVPRS